MLSQLSLSICISQFNHMQCMWRHLEAKFAACVDILAVPAGLAKNGDAYFSAVSGSMKEPIAALGPHKHQEC